MAAAGADEICNVEYVNVGGNQAVWIFTEFETDVALPSLVAWLTPEDWPKWGTEMFSSMTQIGDRVDVMPGKQWHADYLEVVNLEGKQLRTVLSCDFKTTDTWAAMTYDLDHSLGRVLTVDRGFLAAIETGGKRQVKALKVVGFRNTVDNALATSVCPKWAKWVMDATVREERLVENGSIGPTAGHSGRPAPSSGEAADLTQGYADRFAATVADMATFYGEYATDVGSRLWSGEYKQRDAAQDSSRLFLRLASDWSKAWRSGLDAMKELADVEVWPTSSAGGSDADTTEFAVVRVSPPARSGGGKKGAPAGPFPVSVSDFVLVSDRPATLKAPDIKVTPGSLSFGGGPVGVRLAADTSGQPPGMYAGNVFVGEPADRREVPALFYVSRARPASKGRVP